MFSINMILIKKQKPQKSGPEDNIECNWVRKYQP